MNLDEFAFFNQQLAGMLQSGIPLEAALRRLSAEMGKGSLRGEIEALERDLAAGRPLGEAISNRKLPPLYVQMLKLGVVGNNLPAMLNLLADYYHKANSVWMRLRTLLVYPGIVLLASMALSIAMALIYGYVTRELADVSGQMFPGQTGWENSFQLMVSLWYPVALIGLLLSLFVAIWTLPRFRSWLSWRIPAFKEASLSQIASGIALMLQNGSTLNQTLELAIQVGAGSPAARELALWQRRLAEGRSQFSELSAGGRFFPPLFVWLVSGSGEDWASGFKNAAEVYYQRAMHKVELMLYAVLPVTVFVLGILIVTQVAPVGRMIVKPMEFMVNTGE